MAVLAFGAVGATPSEVRADPYAQPGRVVRLPDGRTVNLVCSGRGSPTVILESGFGAGAFAWGQVQPVVAPRTRVCSYDRAGYGFSDPGPSPRDGAAIARDLDGALRRAGERGPFVVVGHSSGGLYARLFAARRRSETVGLVLVDPSVPFQDRRFAAAFGAGVGGLEGVRRHPAACLKAVESGSQAALEAEGCLPKQPAQARAAARRPGGWRTQVSELDTLFTTTSEQVNRTRPVLKDIPTIVLTASPTGVAAGQEDPGGMVWQSLHEEIVAGSLGGQHRLVKSSHLMMSDRPEIVAGAILELVDASRKAAAQRR
jgi:pimeloyl-ACP methyl ester carboxylesterase